MRFDQLVIQIKAESRISGDDTLNATVVGLLNEQFKEAVESQRPPELRNEVIIDLATGTGSYALPDDYFIFHKFIFQDVDTGREYELVDSDDAVPPAPRGLFGHPKAFEVEGVLVSLKPKIGIVTGDHLQIVYYQKPPVVDVENLAVDNPIERLEPFLIRSTIRRLRMFHSDDLQVAQMLQGDISSAAQGYSKDEPEKPPR